MTTDIRQGSLARAIDRLIERFVNLKNGGGPQRIETEIEPTDPLVWLSERRGDVKSYWRSRDDRFEFVGLGAADLIKIDAAPDFDQLSSHLAANLTDTDPGLRYYGGFRFDPRLADEKRDARWAPFGSCRLVLHRFELIRDNNGCRLACNLLESDRTDAKLTTIADTARKLTEAEAQGNPRPGRPTERLDFPDRFQWLENVKQAVDSFRNGDSRKLVLARRASMAFESVLSPWSILDRLRERSANCFLFGIQLDDRTSFVGATPERLFARTGREIQTEAMAGTRPRGDDPESDRIFSEELTGSPKELHEHGLVVRGISAGLEGICECHQQLDGPSPYKLARIQHLRSRFTGRLRDSVNDFEIIAALHPSAAVGGYPVAEAPALLHQFEPFDRGWYAGQVGWLSADAAEFAVAIRSALISGSRLDLFSGAGIVRDSRPEAEWDEVEAKIGQFLRLTDGPER